MWVGAAGNGVTGVRIHLNNHTTVTAAVGAGYFAAWWPSQTNIADQIGQPRRPVKRARFAPQHPWNGFVGWNVGFLVAAPTVLALKPVYTILNLVYTLHMTKRLVDIDEEALHAARSQLGTTTIKATVNEALRLVGSDRSEVVRNSMDVLSAIPLSDRDDAWR